MSGKMMEINEFTNESDILDLMRDNQFRCRKRDGKHPAVQGDAKACGYCKTARDGKPCPHLEFPEKTIKICRRMSNVRIKKGTSPFKSRHLQAIGRI